MIFGGGGRILRQTHIVAPLAKAEPQFVSRERAGASQN